MWVPVKSVSNTHQCVNIQDFTHMVQKDLSFWMTASSLAWFSETVLNKPQIPWFTEQNS